MKVFFFFCLIFISLFSLFFYILIKGSEPVPSELLEKTELPKLAIAGIALAVVGLLLINGALVAWFILRKKSKGIFHFFYFFYFIEFLF